MAERAGGARFVIGEDLTFSLGFAARSRLEDDPWFFPYLGFELQLTDRLRFVSRGSEVAAVYTANEALEADLTFTYDIRQFRLNEDGPLPGGVVEDEEILAELGLTWTPSENVRVEANAGVTLWRELQAYDQNGFERMEPESDPAPFAGIGLSVVL